MPLTRGSWHRLFQKGGAGQERWARRRGGGSEEHVVREPPKARLGSQKLSPRGVPLAPRGRCKEATWGGSPQTEVSTPRGWGGNIAQSLPCDRVHLLHHTEQAPLPTLSAGEQQRRGCGHRGHLKIYNQQQPLSSATAVSVPGSPHQPGLEHRFVLRKDIQTLAPAFAN